MTETTETTEATVVSGSRQERVVMKPCEIACEKCGSEDIARAFIAKGEPVPHDGYDKCKNKYGAGQCHYWLSVRDHIHHNCRTCQFTWQTLPMKKKKAS